MNYNPELTREQVVELCRNKKNPRNPNRVLACQILGHSPIVTQDRQGQQWCGRCGVAVGTHPAHIVVGRNTLQDRKNYAKTKWQERLYAKHPITTDYIGS